MFHKKRENYAMRDDMRRIPDNDHDNDFEVEITALDTPETPGPASDRLLQGSRLAPSVRTWLTVLSGVGSILLIVVVLATVLPSFLPKIKTTPTPSPIHIPLQIQNVTVQNDFAYVTSSDGMGRVFRVKDGTLLWQRKLPDVTPVFIKNIMYIYYYDQQFYTVQALRVSDGKSLWTFKASSANLLPLIIDDGVATVLSDNPQQMMIQGTEQNKTLIALNSNNGAEMWQYNILVSSPANLYIQTNSNNIYINMWSDYQMYNISLFVLKSNDGLLLWHYNNPDLRKTTPNTYTPPMLILPLVLNGPVYLRMGDGSLRAMDANNGHEVWYYKPANPDDIMSMTGISHFYIQTAKGSIEALIPDNGTIDWSYNDPAGIITIFSETDGILYVETGDGFVVALRTNDGKKLWRVQPIAPPFKADALYIAGNTAYTFMQIGNATSVTITALRVSDGMLLWRRMVNLSVAMQFPQISNDQIFIDAGTTITALRARDGAVLWHASNVRSDFQYGLPIAIVGNVVFLRLSSSALEVHQAQTGTILWRYPHA